MRSVICPGDAVAGADALRLGRADQGAGGLGGRRAGARDLLGRGRHLGPPGRGLHAWSAQHPSSGCAAIAELLDDPKPAQWLADSGRRRLATDYSREAVRRQLLEVIAP